jgi:hypothetical protein
MSATRQTLRIQGRTFPLLALVLSLVPGCITEPDTVDNDATKTVVQIVSMEGQPFDDQGAGEEGTDLFSDVCNAVVFQTGCGVFNDNGIVTMIAFPKDRTRDSTGAFGLNSVQFERYRVTYVRADGRNVPGVDVPYPFDGAANFLVPVNGTSVVRAFVVVRHQAKSESPLREISGNLAARLSVIAQIDFFGRDGSGRTIKVTGYLNITFSDFG